MWEALSDLQREEYREVARADLPKDIATITGVNAIAKALAWDARLS